MSHPINPTTNLQHPSSLLQMILHVVPPSWKALSVRKTKKRRNLKSEGVDKAGPDAREKCKVYNPRDGEQLINVAVAYSQHAASVCAADVINAFSCQFLPSTRRILPRWAVHAMKHGGGNIKD